MVRKIFVVSSGPSNGLWIDGCEIVKNLKDADIVVFPGGADVDPSNYGCKDDPHAGNWPNKTRDAIEIEVFNKMSSNQIAVGICRGHQLLATRFGGILIQDCENHFNGPHKIINNLGEEYITTSLHHQMVYLPSLDPRDYDLLYWAAPKRSKYYIGDRIDESLVEKEPEVMVFHREGMPLSIGIQGHPEMMSFDSPFVKMINSIIKKYI